MPFMFSPKTTRFTPLSSSTKTCLSLALVLFALSSVFAQQSGKVIGHIMTAETNEALVGANVVLTGTRYGAAADLNGDFMILNLPAGIYELQAMMIGYTPVVIYNIEVAHGLTTRLDITLSLVALEGKEVTIYATKPLIQKDITYSSHFINAEQIESLPVDDYKGVLAMNPGFTRDAKGFLRSEIPGRWSNPAGTKLWNSILRDLSASPQQ
jgi:hypothetical protein